MTEQERRLLTLLAQGHTAKTIASAEGLSVNVVNERLRSARRKTGAVSSRELARLVGPQTSQENRAKFFGIEPAPDAPHPGRRRGPATGAGRWLVGSLIVMSGILVLVAVATWWVGAQARPEGPVRMPMPLPNLAETGPSWQAVTADSRYPAITYLIPSPDGRAGVFVPQVILSCRDISMSLTVRGFAPQPSWPQPDLTMRIGTVDRVGPPTAVASATGPTLGYKFAIADEVLQPLGRGEPVSFIFNGETQAFPVIPEALRSAFVTNCAALVHPGMRRRGAAGDRVW
ncbi:helix-turn-helix transcriptional regulator [Brevundimonas goettingensis]|uniref:Helix-turn-helix transcriptional regulator n=1 Tax=Brevundimonas goettingensis TaxID=2774190 RepID=A0A975GXT1_9CAUL|nr:helix-turn-helix transcriptional regulator [Brevundimonas goettingensis]